MVADLHQHPWPESLLAGESLSFGAADIHRVSHAGDEPAVTLHAYSPAMSRPNDPRDIQLGGDEFLSLSASKSTLAKSAVARDEFLSLSGRKSHLV